MTQTSAWEEERVWRGYEEEKVAGGGQFYKGYFPYLPLWELEADPGMLTGLSVLGEESAARGGEG